MTSVVILILLVVGTVAFFGIRSALRRKQRGALLKERLTSHEREALTRDFPLFGKLPEPLRDELEGIMHVFLDEKSFEPCGELDEVSPHMQRVIAAQACLLLVNRKHDYYRALRSILIYPTAYTARDEHGGESVRLGESWNSGSVVLAWESVVTGGHIEEDGHHVTLHEFAHQLDQVDGAADGVPELSCGRSYREWSRVFSRAYENFTRRVDRGKRTVIDDYGATNPAEFFAVATETFYEKPRQLKENYPEVYQQLKRYYQVDPLEW